MSLTVAEARAVNAILGWLDELAIWECQGGNEDAVRAALPLLAKAAHKRLMTGHSEASGRAVAVRLLGDGTPQQPGREAYGRRDLLDQGIVS